MTIHLTLQGGVPPAATAARLLRERGIRRWVYLGENAAWRINAERSALQGIPLESIAGVAGQMADHLRDPYIEWIGELSTENAAPEWWACELAAKNPYTYLFTRICALATAQEILPDLGPDTLVVCSTPALLAEVSASADALGVPVRPAWDGARGASIARTTARAGARGAIRAWTTLAPPRLLELPTRIPSGALRLALEDETRYRRRVLDAAGAEIPPGLDHDQACLLVTWADDRSIEADGSYADPHFGALADLLRGTGMQVAYLPRVLPNAPFAATARRLIATGEPLVFGESLLTDADLRWCSAVAGEYRPHIPPHASVAGVPVARLAGELVDEQRRQHRSNLRYLPLARRLAEAGVRPRLIILPFEGHAWEQTLTAGIRRHLPNTEVIGYDNVNFSRFALSLYPSRSELELRPLPDRVVTNGPLFRRILIAEGFPEERIRVGCALRHAYLSEGSPPAEVGERDEVAGVQTVVVAGTIDAAQSVELVERAAAAFGGDSRYRIAVKLHPAADAKLVRELTRGAGECSNLRYVDRPIRDLLADADMMLYSYSVVCYEALAAAVPPVFLGSESFLDLDQLEPYPGLGWRARTVEELRTVAAEITVLRGEERERWARQAAQAVREALKPGSPECVRAFLD